MRTYWVVLLAAILLLSPGCDDEDSPTKEDPDGEDAELVFLDHCPGGAGGSCTAGTLCYETYRCSHCSFTSMDCTCSAEGTWQCSYFDDFRCLERCRGDACADDSECTTSGESCLVPNAMACGTCQMGVACLDDDACSGDSLCVARNTACLCDPGAAICAPPCTDDAPCPYDGDVCIDGRCQPQPCADTTCSERNFVCNDDKVCVREACDENGKCSNWNDHCVKGLCYDKLGTCSLPPP